MYIQASIVENMYLRRALLLLILKWFKDGLRFAGALWFIG